MSAQRAYVVVPFERIGSSLGPRQAIVVDGEAQAKLLARRWAARVSGAAVLERTIDPDTGDGIDTLIVGFGAIPPTFPHSPNWTLMLH